MSDVCGEPLCTTTIPHHTHSDAHGRCWCCQPYPYAPVLPAPEPDADEVERLALWLWKRDGFTDRHWQTASTEMRERWHTDARAAIGEIRCSGMMRGSEETS